MQKLEALYTGLFEKFNSEETVFEEIRWFPIRGLERFSER